MIQKTNGRHVSSALTSPARLQPQTQHQGHHSKHSDHPEIWGQWIGSRYYSLEVIQHPLRARMCGFGDKDRRPLAPAAVAKMVVRAEDNSVVDIDDIDYSFFIATVDLWSVDMKREMNLVLHPSSADRYIPTQVSKPRRRPTLLGHPSAPRPQSPTAQNGYPPRTMADPSAPPIPQPGPGYPAQGYPPFDPFHFGGSHYPSSWSYPPPVAGPQNQPPQYSPHALPSIHAFGKNTSPPATADSWHSEPLNRDGADVSPFRAWNAEHVDSASSTASHPPASSVDQAGRIGPIDSSLRGPDSAGTQLATPEDPPGSREGWPSGDDNSSSMVSVSNAPHQRGFPTEPYEPRLPVEAPVYGQLSSYGPPPPSYGLPAPQSPPSPPTPPVPYNRQNYTRTLVGPLSANATRLLDEHRKPGIFFLFQDLSIRTEGNFRLRMRLMNVGAPPAPNAGSNRVHNDISPILAQTFTDPFTVFSAKRFPGVPDTTALSIAFGNQGQKLPLRNRHGSNKRQPSRRGVGRDDSDSDGDSD